MNARHLPANALAKALGPAGAESTPAVHLPPTPGQLVSCKLPTRWGEFDLHGLVDAVTGAEHAAMSLGRLDDGEPVLTRLHSECLTGDTLYSLKCDCGTQLEGALQAIAQAGRGVLLLGASTPHHPPLPPWHWPNRLLARGWRNPQAADTTRATHAGRWYY